MPRTRKNVSKIGWLFLCINFLLLITLGIFAKDNLLAELDYWLPASASRASTNVPSVGTIEVAFSPNSGATATIIKAIAEARTSILVSAYSFTSKDIANVLLQAKQRGVLVKIILDKSQVSARYSSSTFFSNQGFDLKIDVHHAIYHNKVMIIDDKTIITGSFNFTKAAETKNAENLLVIRDNLPLAQAYKKNWQYHWDRSMSLEEFSRKKFSNKSK